MELIQKPGVDFELSAASNVPIFNNGTFNSAVFSSVEDIPASRYITLLNNSLLDPTVEIYVTTHTNYSFVGNELVFDNNVIINDGDVIAVTLYSDPTELKLYTELFEGPVLISDQFIANGDLAADSGIYFPNDFVAGEIITYVDGSMYYPISTTAELTVNAPDAGIYTDLTTNTIVNEPLIIKQNIYTLARSENVINSNRLWVTLNGKKLNAGDQYEIINTNQLHIFGNTLNVRDEIVVTSMTESVITNGVSFRIFQDMRKTTASYSMSTSHETYLLEDLNKTDDIIYVRDASKLGKPNLANNQLGILTINGERISYRERDLVNNTVSGIRRGIAGTALFDHVKLDKVYNVSKNALVPTEYNRIWYESIDNVASNGIPLQDQQTISALFIKK